MGDKRLSAALIAHQHGHITRRQLLEAGIPASTIANWIAAGDLIRVHAGVYAVRYPRVEPVARACAAVLACGDGAVLSHGSALALCGAGAFPAMAEVTCPDRRRHPTIRTHRSTTLTRDDITAQLNIPCTTVARAIADTHRRFTDRQLTRLVQDARRSGDIKGDALTTLLKRCPRLAALIDPGQNPTRSSLEDLLLPWLAQHGLPTPILNHQLNGYEVDAYFPEQNLILELDGWHYHRSHDSFHADRERDAHHLAHGTPTVRLTANRLTGREADRLRQTLRGQRA